MKTQDLLFFAAEGSQEYPSFSMVECLDWSTAAEVTEGWGKECKQTNVRDVAEWRSNFYNSRTKQRNMSKTVWLVRK